MTTHSSILAWRILWTKEPGGLQSMGPQESDTTERLTFSFQEVGYVRKRAILSLIYDSPGCSCNEKWTLLSRDSMDCNPPGSSVHGILQARILEWAVIPFSRGSSRDQTCVSRMADGFFTTEPPGKRSVLNGFKISHVWVKTHSVL